MTTLELIVGAASLVTAMAAIVGLYLTRKEMRENREGGGERNRHLSDVVRALAEIVGIQGKQVEALAGRLDAIVSEQQRRVAIAERQRLDNEQQQKIGLLIAGFKALSWMYDRGWFE